MTLTRVAHKRKVRASNAETHRSRTFPNHQARCAPLILLRFEFANEFRPPSSRRGPLAHPRALAMVYIETRRPAAFRPRRVTPNRGDNVASPRRTRQTQIKPRPDSVGHRSACRRKAIAGKAGRSEHGSIRTAQFLWKRLFCQMNFLQALPAGANRVASIRRRVAHRVEGGSQPEGPGSSPSRRHALITACGKRPAKYGVAAVIEASSTGN